MGAIVKVRNVKLGDGMPKICIPVTDTNLDDLKKSVNLIRNTPFDLIEWRRTSTPVWKIPKSGSRQ